MTGEDPLKIVPVLASLACAAALTACSSTESSSAPSPSAVFSTVTSTSATAAPSTVTTTAQPATGDQPVEPVGTVVTIAGEPATVCIMGDGFGTNVWATNADTSCEFVSATYEVLTDGLNATDVNLRSHLPGQIAVTSPVTKQDYTLACSQVDNRLIRCAGGDNSAVYIY